MDREEYYLSEDSTALAGLAATLEHFDDEDLQALGVDLEGNRPREYYRGLFTGLIYGFRVLSESFGDFKPERRNRKQCRIDMALGAIAASSMLRNLSAKTTTTTFTARELMEALQNVSDPDQPVFAVHGKNAAVHGFVHNIVDRTTREKGKAVILKLSADDPNFEEGKDEG